MEFMFVQQHVLTAEHRGSRDSWGRGQLCVTRVLTQNTVAAGTHGREANEGRQEAERRGLTCIKAEREQREQS